MKLNKLDSTTQPISAEAKRRARVATAAPVLRVEASEGIEGDRERSLSQELASVDPRAVGDYHGQQHLAGEVHALAEALSALGRESLQLIDTRSLDACAAQHHTLDDKA